MLHRLLELPVPLPEPPPKLLHKPPLGLGGGATGRVAQSKGAAIAGRGNKGGGRGLSPVRYTEILAELITDFEEGPMKCR